MPTALIALLLRFARCFAFDEAAAMFVGFVVRLWLADNP